MKIILKRLPLILAILSAAAADATPQIWYLSTRAAAHCGSVGRPGPGRSLLAA